MSKIKHNYTNELELKSLLIRVKNMKEEIGTEKYNRRINKYLRYYDSVSKCKTDNVPKRAQLKKKIKKTIISLSEETMADYFTYEKFGKIILLMIKNILRKPNFSGYTYTDDFYSDAVSKVIKYMHNFDHTLISDRTNQPVNSFSYISQYIHNSIVFVINTKKKDQEKIKKIINADSTYNNNVTIFDDIQDSYFLEDQIVEEEHVETIEIDYIDSENQCLYEIIKDMDLTTNTNVRTIIKYPSCYEITFDEYNLLKEILNSNISIERNT